jgi:hypothetical protein
MTAKTTYTLEETAKLCGKQLELVISSDQKEYDDDNFIVRSPDFSAYGCQCPEQAIKNFEYKVVLLNAIQKDIENANQNKKATEDFKKLGLGYLLNLYECYNSNGGTFYVDHDRELDPIKFFDEAIDLLSDMAQTVRAAKSMEDMDFLPAALGNGNDFDRGYSCTIWDGYSEKVFPNLLKTVQDIQDSQDNDFDTII